MMQSPVLPKYYQVEQRLRRRIAAMAAGEALPSEPDLAREYGISRSTVRSAIEALVNEGKLLRVQGRGTFVVDTAFEFPVGYHKRGLSPEIDELADHEIIELSVVRSADSARLLEIGANDPILRVTRLTRMNGTPMGIGRLWVPRQLLPAVKKSDFAHGRFFYNLADLGLRIDRYRLTIESVIIDTELGEILGIRAGLPGLGLNRIGYNANGSVVAIVDVTTRGDIARYVVEMDSGQARERLIG